MKSRFVVLLVICILLASCSPSTPTGPSKVSETDPTVPSTLFNTPPADTTPDPDMVPDTTSLSLAELETEYTDCYVMIVPGEDSAVIYRIWIRNDMGAQKVSYIYTAIDCYETDAITPEFFNGGSVAIHSAIRNTINFADYETFGSRYYVQPNKSDISAAADAWAKGDTIIICYPKDGSFLTLDIALLEQGSLNFDSPDKGLVQLMLLLYADRGTGIQHFS